MSNPNRRLILLGPQPEYRSLCEAMGRLDHCRRLGLISAGWEEDEANDEEIRNSLDGYHIENLALFKRSEQLFASDAEFIKGLQKRQDELRELRNVYQIRLEALLSSSRKLLTLPDGQVDFEPERENSVDAIRRLDQQYFFRTSQIIDRYEDQLKTDQRPDVMHHRIELTRIIDDMDALVISGGHAAIVLNRLKIFGVLEMKPFIPIVAWSAGAMALADQIVFFHDSPPQGPGDPEVLRPGMGYYTEILPFPDGKNRLHLDDLQRVSLMARRFSRFACVVFDEQTILDRIDGHWRSEGEPLQMMPNGTTQVYSP